MSKLDEIRQVLNKDPNLIWNEQSLTSQHLRREGSYCTVAFSVAPKKPILDFTSLHSFTQKLEAELIPVGPTNRSECYDYAEAYRHVIKTATLYYSEPVNENVEGFNERRLSVTVYPCEVMAENMGVRGLIEIGYYECPTPCSQKKKCTFRGNSKGRIISDIRLFK